MARNASRNAVRNLRVICWTVVVLAVAAAGNGSTGPGGATFGLILAATLATALHLTAKPKRRKRR